MIHVTPACSFFTLSHAVLLADQLVDLIEYHIIEGLMPVPRGWKGSSVPTLLPGHNLTVRIYKR
jgi:hypothetical protein